MDPWSNIREAGFRQTSILRRIFPHLPGAAPFKKSTCGPTTIDSRAGRSQRGQPRRAPRMACGVDAGSSLARAGRPAPTRTTASSRPLRLGPVSLVLPGRPQSGFPAATPGASKAAPWRWATRSCGCRPVAPQPRSRRSDREGADLGHACRESVLVQALRNESTSRGRRPDRPGPTTRAPRARGSAFRLDPLPGCASVARVPPRVLMRQARRETRAALLRQDHRSWTSKRPWAMAPPRSDAVEPQTAIAQLANLDQHPVGRPIVRIAEGDRPASNPESIRRISIRSAAGMIR